MRALDLNLGPTAALAFPPHTVSYYITNFNAAYVENLGYQSGQLGEAGVVALHFGSQAILDDGSRGIYNWNMTFHRDSEVAQLAEVFARGYFRGGGGPNYARVLIATNNSCSCHDAVAGTWWGYWVNAANAWLADPAANGDQDYSARVQIYGGDDIEMNFGPPSGFRAFLDAYGAATLYGIYDTGDCGGCPWNDGSTDAAINNGWHLSDVWYASWGADAAFPMPEIYYGVGNGDNAHQWKSVSLYSVHTHVPAYPKLLFDSTLSEWGACYQTGTCSTGYLTPDQAWQALTDALNEDPDTATTPSFESDVQWTIG